MTSGLALGKDAMTRTHVDQVVETLASGERIYGIAGGCQFPDAAGIAAALARDGPVLVDAVVNRTELAMPPAVTTEMAKRFTLYMVRP